MSGQTFRHTHRVTYAECTLGNHVYYARYLDMLEVARNEFFRTLGTPMLDWQNANTIFPIIECHLQYRAPARYDDVLTLELRVSQMTRVRLQFACRVLNQNGALILEARTVHVCTSVSEKPRRLPPSLVQSLQPYCADVSPGA
ncbi:MAG: acyl-CoA thioesterase [Chloroflexi bacterium]|nr:acyl-CoA thioesterase [Chloroflexota bacterium]